MSRRLATSALWISLLTLLSLAARGETLFERLAPADTGVDFTGGALAEAPGAGEFETSSGRDTAGGVALGDVDGDGRCDIFLTRAKGGNSLYRNLGGWKFEDITEQAGVSGGGMWSTGCSFVDIDNDGDLDLFVCGYETPNQLYINDGKAKFVERAAQFGLDFNGGSVMMAFADYDCDGDLDGYLVTNDIKRVEAGTEVKLSVDAKTGEVQIPEDLREVIGAFYFRGAGIKTFAAGQADILYRNNGGKFVDVSDEAGIGGYEMGLSAVWWDHNQDGLPDLYVANDFYGQDHLYQNNGDGTFTDVIRTAIPHTPWYSMGCDSGDLNNDGLPDLMASDMAGRGHYKDKMGMGDMNEEGWFLTYPTPRQYMRNAVYINSGGPRFFEVAHMAGLASTDWTWSILFGDYDNDGWLDIFATNGMTRDLFNSDLKDAESAIKAKGDEKAASEFWGSQELKRDPNYVFHNLGDLQFEELGEAWGLDHLGVSFGAASADLDNDGDLDLVVNNFGEPASIFRNRASAGENHWLRIRLRGSESNRHGIGATVRLVTGSGQTLMRTLTLAHGYMSAGEPAVHFGLGREAQVRELKVEWPSGRVQTLANPAVDQLHTLVEPDGGERPEAASAKRTWFREQSTFNGTGRIEPYYDDFARQPLLPHRLSNLGPGLAWGDVDGDGDDDCYHSQPRGVGGAIYFNDGNHNFHVATPKPFDQHAACEDMAPVFFDADGDGDLDLYVVSGSVECEPGAEVLRDRLCLNDGKGGFATAPDGALPDLRTSGSTAAAADFDRDGDIDLFVGGRAIPGRYPEMPQSHLLSNDGKGKFSASAMEIGLVTAALWSDVDNDGWLDLMVTSEWGPVRIFQNREGNLIERTEAAGLAKLTGWWNGITGGDIDNDGDIDYVVTNFGLNTKYSASQKKPALLYYGDLDGTGKPHLIEAKVDSAGTLLPGRGFSCSRNAMPFLTKKFKTYHNFASSSLTELYTDPKLAGATRFEATTLETGMLINDGRGRFVFKPLPRLAQVAPAFGVALADLDGDSHLDCVLAQNFFSPQRETGRMDGGQSLVMQGDGCGNFTGLLPPSSGVSVPGDAKCVTIADLNADAWPDLIFGVNNDELKVFENTPGADLRRFQVLLPEQPGTRAAVELSDGSSRVAEVYSGSGYLGQSAAKFGFGLAGNLAVIKVELRHPDGSRSEHPVDGKQRLDLRTFEPLK